MGGIKIPYTIKSEETTLLLNGAGVREKYFIDLFALGLYLKAKCSDAHKIMNADEPMALKLCVLSHLITSDRMYASMDEGFKRATEGNTAPIAERIVQFKTIFANNFKKGDVFDFIYSPLKGTSIYKNNAFLMTIPGLDFKKAFFGIWMFKRPPDSDIQERLLGKK